MHKVLELLVLAALSSCGVGFSEDFCALRITVVSTEGEVTQYPFPVALLDPSDKVIERTVLRNGQASFCDFGFDDHSVAIGYEEEEGCSPTIIRHLRLRLGYHQELKVIDNPCKGWGFSSFNCGFYLRIRDDTGQKLAGAEIWSNGKVLLRADGYGRAHVAVMNGTTRESEVKSPGYRSEQIHLSCGRDQQFEREIILHRAQP